MCIRDRVCTDGLTSISLSVTAFLTTWPAERLSSGTNTTRSPSTLAVQLSRYPSSRRSPLMNFSSTGRHAETFSIDEVTPYRSKKPSSMRTLHLPHVRFSPQMASISTPSSRLACRMDLPSSTFPRLPDGWKITVCILFSLKNPPSRSLLRSASRTTKSSPRQATCFLPREALPNSSPGVFWLSPAPRGPGDYSGGTAPDFDRLTSECLRVPQGRRRTRIGSLPRPTSTASTAYWLRCPVVRPLNSPSLSQTAQTCQHLRNDMRKRAETVRDEDGS